MPRENINSQFVLVRNHNFEGDNKLGIYMDENNLYIFGDGDGYTPQQIADGMLGNEIEWLTWMEVEQRLCQ